MVDIRFDLFSSSHSLIHPHTHTHTRAQRPWWLSLCFDLFISSHTHTHTHTYTHTQRPWWLSLHFDLFHHIHTHRGLDSCHSALTPLSHHTHTHTFAGIPIRKISAGLWGSISFFPLFKLLFSSLYPPAQKLCSYLTPESLQSLEEFKIMLPKKTLTASVSPVHIGTIVEIALPMALPLTGSWPYTSYFTSLTPNFLNYKMVSCSSALHRVVVRTKQDEVCESQLQCAVQLSAMGFLISPPGCPLCNRCRNDSKGGSWLRINYESVTSLLCPPARYSAGNIPFKGHWACSSSWSRSMKPQTTMYTPFIGLLVYSECLLPYNFPNFGPPLLL